MSNLKFLVLDRIRISLNVLKKSDLFKNPNTEEGNLLSEFKEIQLSLRNSDSLDQVEFSKLLSPFLKILQSTRIAGPFKLTALESLQTLIKHQIFSLSNISNILAVNEIVNSVIGCKFIQTDVLGDEIVQIQLLKTLECIVQNISYFIGVEPCWQILQFAFNTIDRAGESKYSLVKHETAEQIVFDTIRYILSNIEVDKNDEKNHSAKVVLLELLQYISKNFKSFSLFILAESQNFGKKDSSTKGEYASFEGPNILFLIQMLQSIWIEAEKNPDILTILICDPEVSKFVHDEIGISLINLGSQFSSLPIKTLQATLSLFNTFLAISGESMRFTVEHFFRQVYLRVMNEVLDIFSVQVGSSHPLHELINKEEETDKSKIQHYFGKIDVYEIVLESLCDLIADDSIISSLYITFDCNPIASDIITPLIKNLTKIASIVLTTGTERLGPVKEVGVIIVQCFKQILSSLSRRKAYEDAWIEEQKSIKDSPEFSFSELQPIVDFFPKMRKNKEILIDAAKKFSEKSADGFKELQKHGILPSPLTPESVAWVLRSIPFFAKPDVGSYLGELGKVDASYESQGQEFHRQTLLRYVESFDLKGHSVLNCLRIFLSAFRLPGEAQQIDRILVAFSEFCFENSLEKEQGILENAEIVYLLTFSIIMLNTDRHNPNIKAERKMTLEQFIRNNSNYGKDVNQTKPLPREYLESIYQSISASQIRTEGNDPLTLVTQEEWMDLQMRLQANPFSKISFSPRHQPSVLKYLSTHTPQIVQEQLCGSKEAIHSLVNIVDVLEKIEGKYWLWDQDFMKCFSQYLLLPGISVLLYNSRVVENSMVIDKESSSDSNGESSYPWTERVGRLFDLSIDFLNDFLTTSNKHKISHSVDFSLAILSEMIGIQNTNLIQKYFSNLTSKTSSMTFNSILPPPSSSGKKETFHSTTSVSFPYHNNLKNRITYQSIQKSLILLLTLISHYRSNIQTWELAIYPLAILRDFSLLPIEMITETDGDLLPSNVRQEFDFSLSKLDKLTKEIEKNETKKVVESASSFLSLQVIGEALFGSSENSNAENKSADELFDFEGTLFKLNLKSSRWDAGYDMNTLGHYPSAVYTKDPIPGSSSSKGTSKNIVYPPSYPFGDQLLRNNIANTNISMFVAETKFLSEDSLIYLLKTIIKITESYLQSELTSIIEYEGLPSSIQQCQDSSSPKKESTTIASESFFQYISNYLDSHGSIESYVSSSSMSWLENLFVDIILRNRDRFQSCLPILKAHYLRCLGNPCNFSYVTERQLNGMLKLSGRMLSRDHYSGVIIEILGRILSPLTKKQVHIQRSKEGLEPSMSMDLEDDFVDPGNLVTLSEGLVGLTNQIAAGMWRILTQNIELLPMLSVEQWETFFNILAVGANGGSFASFKTFEVMAWLLHEPRLIARVPVFCIIAVKPLVKNQQAPVFVSVGAVKLLKYLHSRLEVLIQQSSKESSPSHDYDNLNQDEDSLQLWKKCWLPILQAFAEGATDERNLVREACALTLCEALEEHHTESVPAGTLIDVLVHVLLPVTHVLVDFEIADFNKEYLNAITSSGRPPAVQTKKPHITPSKPVQKHVEPVIAQDWSIVDKVEADPISEHLRAVNSDSSSKQPDEPITIKCLNALKNIFISRFKKLFNYPSFDKLWLQILHVLTHLITTVKTNNNFNQSNRNIANLLSLPPAHTGSTAPPFPTSTANETLDELTKNITLTLEICYSNLRVLLDFMLAEKTFSKRQGLQAVTHHYLEQICSHNNSSNSSEDAGKFTLDPNYLTLVNPTS